MTENNAPVVAGYKPPAVSIRATYTVGDTTDELTVDIDQWDGDVAVITGVINALTEAKPGSDVQVDAPAMVSQIAQGSDNVRRITTAGPAGGLTIQTGAGSEAQA